MPLPLPLQPPESWGVWAHPSRKMHGREVTNSGPSPWGELWSSGASVDECLGVHHRCHGAQAFGGARLGGGEARERAEHSTTHVGRRWDRAPASRAPGSGLSCVNREAASE